jgi:uncharacterized protein (TIGR00255 family)
MIKSMTGFGKSECELPDKRVTIEIKTLNSKQFDMQARIPNVFREKELDLRMHLNNRLERGKVDLNISVDETAGYENFTINRSLAKKYYDQIRLLSADLNLTLDDQILSTLLKLPDVMKAEPKELREEEWAIILKAIDEAILRCDEFRQMEGNKLEIDFDNRIGLILDYLNALTPFEEERIHKIKSRFRKDLQEVVSEQKIDENRFEQEVIYYLEKIDITEEKTRLKSHCDYFLVTLLEPFSNGKKLSFIGQEIGREINTIGSKANDYNMQKIVVQMKDELEKIKEQLMNIL